MRILIAEDDQVLADGLLRALRASGAAVDHVANGSEADAALMTSSEFDLIILDLGLPKMHGLEVLKRLRARGNSMPVLILTAADSVEERVKGLDYGADDYMAKPFSLQELEARVRALIRRLGKDRAIILSTHLLEEVEAVCTRAVIINRGVVVFDGTPAAMDAQAPATVKANRLDHVFRQLTTSDVPGGKA